jgi:hypothetical protein
MSEQQEEYGLLVSFPDQSEQFVHGFEAGQVWERLENEKQILIRGERLSMTVHQANQEVITRMARHYGFSAEFAPESFVNGWCSVSFVKGGAKLSVVNGGKP